MSDITLPLKEILDKGFPPPDSYKIIADGAYVYIPKNGSSTFRHIPRREIPDGVAFMFDGPFLPIRNGACYTLYNLMRSLSEAAAIEPILINCFRGWDNYQSYYRQSFDSIFVGPRDYYHDTGLIQKIFSENNLKLAQFYNGEILLNIGSWLRKNGVKAILEIQNIEYILLERLGEPKNKVEKAKLNQSQAIQFADHIFCRSEIDKKYTLLMGADEKKITVYRGGIKVQDFVFKPRLKTGKQLVYLGHMYYQPNEDALELIASRILPNLDGDYKLTVIGNTPPYLIKKYAGSPITFKHGVDDINQELMDSDIAIAPLLAGSGTRLKLLDYLASGLPIITTHLGVEGLDPAIQKYMTIEDDINKYADCISDISMRPQYYVERARLGRKFIEDNYDWKHCLKPFHEAYSKLMSEKSH